MDNTNINFFNKKILIKAFAKNCNSFILKGLLKDQRLLKYKHYLSEKIIDPGTIHNIEIEMELTIPNLKIIKINNKMKNVPNKKCLDISLITNKLLGLEIKKDFIKNVMNLIGREKGCVHITNLIIAMSSAAVQALFTIYSSNELLDNDNTKVNWSQLSQNVLINSCWLWKPNGPYIPKLLKAKKTKDKLAYIITIDGPVGSGKSTISKLLAHKLDFSYLNSGSIYRALALEIVKKGISIYDQIEILKYIKNIKLQLLYNNKQKDIIIIINNNYYSEDFIKTEENGFLASTISKIFEIRNLLLPIQRDFVKTQDIGIICEGRDMGNIVFPNADLKIYLDATIEERSYRKKLELANKKIFVDIENIKQDIFRRDNQDMNRNIAPLEISKNAIFIDSTNLSVDDVINKIMNSLCYIIPKTK